MKHTVKSWGYSSDIRVKRQYGLIKKIDVTTFGLCPKHYNTVVTEYLRSSALL